VSPGIQPGEQKLLTFLLARFTEDEATAADKHDRYDCDLHHLETYGCCSCDYPARVLAECEAKRLAIKAAQEERRDLERNEGAIPGLPLVIRALALPYVDHPDYRQEWLPYN